ncbi:MAG TPA: HNH endonuclease signature motif containing protein, partial [Acidobacteriota bacterium]|nr:HNH endonuclease signature motif containing protein [Acidobacteriota bacterium]
VKRKYFHSVGDRQWRFSGTIVDRNGDIHWVRLYEIALTPVTRHVKIQGAANAYDPEWEMYFEHRLGVQMEHNLKGRRWLLYLWKEQNGICPICDEKITKMTGWHAHHVIWRSKGGNDGIDNRILLHPECHRQVHSRGIKVSLPRPKKGV